MNTSNFILGTAQINQNYGITNNKKKIKDQELIKIIDFLQNKKRSFIETANNYSQAEERLGNLNINPVYYTKLSPIESSITKILDTSLRKLKVDRIEGFFFHNLNEFLKADTSKIIDQIHYLKSKNIIKKFGFSIYNPNEIYDIAKFKPDMVQFPINFADRRFSNSRNNKLLKDLNAELFGRSIFLQGLLFYKEDNLPLYFRKWIKYFTLWTIFLKKNNLTPIAACLQFVNSLNFIDNKIIGVTSLNELTEVFDNDITSNHLSFEEIFPSDMMLINPVNW